MPLISAFEFSPSNKVCISDLVNSPPLISAKLLKLASSFITESVNDRLCEFILSSYILIISKFEFSDKFIISKGANNPA